MRLPYLGLGLSSNAQTNDLPAPYRLLEEVPGAFDFLEYSAPLDVDAASREATLFATMLNRKATVPLLYHPVHMNLWGPKVESAERLALLARHLSEVESPWVSNDVGWWHCEGLALPGYLYLTPPLNAEGLQQVAVHARVVRDAMPVPLLLENPVVMTARGDWHVLDFMERLAKATACDLLLDVGHLFSHQLARGLELTAGLADFDFSRVAEVHIAGGVVTQRGGRGLYVDDHPQPIRDEVWSLLEYLLPKCTRLRALTYEGDGHPMAVAKLNLRRLRSLLPGGAHVEQPVRPEGLEGPISPSPLSTWSLFDDVHRGRCPEDPVGAEAELNYRLAVIAQTLDAVIPLTRLAVAPTRSALATFVGSAEFRAWFEQGTLELTDVFTAWAMRRLRDPELVGAEALVSLEIWARQTGRRLAPGASMTATFAVCLSDALHAAKALPRHLSSRAWWSTVALESSGLSSGLLQAARRATPGPWPLTLRRIGARIEISEAVSAAG